MMTEQQTKHKARHLEMQHMTPQRAGCPGAPHRRRQTMGEQECRRPAPSAWSVHQDKSASNAIIWLTDPNPFGMLKDSLVSRIRIQNQIPLSLLEMIPWMETTVSLLSPIMSSSTPYLSDIPSNLSYIRVICVYACLSSPLDCKPEGQCDTSGISAWWEPSIYLLTVTVS